MPKKKIGGAAWNAGRSTVYRKGKAAKNRKKGRASTRQLRQIKKSLKR
jgi:hypothetical protein